MKNCFCGKDGKWHAIYSCGDSEQDLILCHDHYAMPEFKKCCKLIEEI